MGGSGTRQPSRYVPEPSFREVGIKAEGSVNAVPLHHLEAHAVHQTQPPTSLRQQSLAPCTVDGIVHPPDRQDWAHVLMKGAHRVHPKPTLGEREGLDQDIAGREQRLTICNQPLPGSPRSLVLLIVRVENSEER